MYAPDPAMTLEDSLSLHGLRRFVGRYERRAAVALAEVRAIEADQVIDTKAVEQRGRAASPMLQPLEVSPRDHVPSVNRQSPVLAGRRKCIRRRPHGRVQSELLLACPHVGTMSADDKREIAENADGCGIAARPLPLLVGGPLQPGAVENFARETNAGALDRLGLTVAELILPFEPVSPGMFLM